MTPAEFWNSTMPVTESGCWTWMGTVDHNGYGSASIDGKRDGAHRYAWRLARGQIPAGMCICHHCDVPPCVNPDHLFLGTHSDNMRDMWRKQRGSHGEKHCDAKLTAEDIEEIRLSKETAIVLAARYGVGQTTIWKAKNGRTWRSIAATPQRPTPQRRPRPPKYAKFVHRRARPVAAGSP